MSRIPRIAAVNDLSGFGRCSLAVALPILSAMGFQVCPLPTVLLSAHTGYPQPHIRDFTEDMGAYLQHWDRLELDFDAVYTGFLGNERQETMLLPLLSAARDRGALRVVDPAMADHGSLYSTCSPKLVAAMRQLVALASVTTPNLTEACLLTGEDYHRVMALPIAKRREAVFAIGEHLLALGCSAAVITGVPGADETLENVVTDGRTGEKYVLSTPTVSRHYAGTGDVFSSVLCGELLRGTDLRTAVERTAGFVYRVTRYTADQDLPDQDGIVFEMFLSELYQKEG